MSLKSMTLEQFHAASKEARSSTIIVMPSTSIEVRSIDVRTVDDIDSMRAKLAKLGAPDDEIEGALSTLREFPDAGEIVSAFKLSSARVDSYKDTIDVDGWDVADFKANPVVLFAHASNMPPIGRDIARWSDGEFLRGVVRFASRDISPFADMVARMVRSGFLSATSVGFEPVEWEESSDAERVGPWGFPAIDFKRQRLREWSIVPVPANADAVSEIRSAVGLDTDHVRAFIEWAERLIDTGSLDGAGFARAARAFKGSTSVFMKRDEQELTEPADVVDEESTEGDAGDDTEEKEATVTCPACGFSGPASSFAVEESQVAEPAGDDDEESDTDEDDIDEERLAEIVESKLADALAKSDEDGGLVRSEDALDDDDLAARVAAMVERRLIDALATKTGRLPF